MPHSTRRRQKHSKLLNRLYPSYCGSGNGCSKTLGDVLRSWGIPEVDGKCVSTQEGTRKRRRVEEWRSLEGVLRNTLVRLICGLWVVVEGLVWLRQKWLMLRLLWGSSNQPYTSEYLWMPPGLCGNYFSTGLTTFFCLFPGPELAEAGCQPLLFSTPWFTFL